jgi:hypothetical protein
MVEPGGDFLMTYLDHEKLAAIDPGDFQNNKPYPWINPMGLITDEGFERLFETLPDVSLFDESFGKTRKYGQASHDRYNLEYQDSLEIADPWREFVGELRGEAYGSFLTSLFAGEPFRLRFHWHYAINGSSVSPHCDSNQKLGSHLFYFNRSDEWNPAWGGSTMVLDDHDRLPRGTNPDFSDFDERIASQILDNASFLFRRMPHSWHGVEEIRCPEGAMRRVFIVVIDGWRLIRRIRSKLERRNVERY